MCVVFLHLFLSKPIIHKSTNFIFPHIDAVLFALKDLGK